jgi:hypothetical protein
MAPQDSVEMRLADDDAVVNALPANRADQAFRASMTSAMAGSRSPCSAFMSMI